MGEVMDDLRIRLTLPGAINRGEHELHALVGSNLFAVSTVDEQQDAAMLIKHVNPNHHFR